MQFSLFYPASLALIGWIVWAGLEPGFENIREMERIRETIDVHGYVIEGDALNEGVAAARTSLDIAGPENRRRALMTAHHLPDEGAPSPGVLFAAPPFALDVFAGRTVEVLIEARAPAEGGAPEALMMLTIPSVGSSGWRSVEVGAEFAKAGFQFKVPDAHDDVPIYVHIWPDAEGGGRFIEVRKVIVRPLA